MGEGTNACKATSRTILGEDHPTSPIPPAQAQSVRYNGVEECSIANRHPVGRAKENEVFATPINPNGIP